MQIETMIQRWAAAALVPVAGDATSVESERALPLVSTLAALGVALVLGCAASRGDAPGEQGPAFATAQRVTLPLGVSAVREIGATRGERTFEVYGDFALPEQVRAEVRCNAARVLSRIAYATHDQINVFIAEPASGAVCTFTLERITDGARSASFGPVHPQPPEIEILGVNDRGVTSGRRFVELYGRFPSPTLLEARVLCDGMATAARLEHASQGQINISMPNTGPASRCTYALRRTLDGRESPVWGAAPARTATSIPGFGAYHWGGIAPISGDSLGRGQRALSAAGFDVARIVITPRVRSGHAGDNYYGLDLADLASLCPTGKPFLPCAIRTPAYQAAISAPDLRTVILTAYDSTSLGDAGWGHAFLDPDFYASDPSRAAAVQQEYCDLTLALYETQHDTGKTFVIGNWETDNAIYCGNAYKYATDPSFRKACDTDRTRFPIPPPKALQGIRQWFESRKAGIAEGRAVAVARGLAGVHVGDGIELNSVRFLQSVVGTHTALDEIIPSVKPQFATYSSYESQYDGCMGEDLAALKARVSPSELLIGEVGFPDHGIDATDAFRTVEMAKAVQRAKLRATVLWEAFDTSADASGNIRILPFGVLDPDGADRPVMASLRAELAAQARELAAPSDLRIDGVNDRGLHAEGGRTFHAFELYGSFLRGPITPTVLCDGIDARAETTWAGDRQLNLRIAHDARQRFCVFKVARSDGTKSLTFGPRPSGPLVPCAIRTGHDGG